MISDVIDHRALLASLSDEERLRLTKRSDLQGLRKLSGTICGLLFTGTWIGFGVPGWQLILIAHGIQIVFLFTLLHETVHDTPFASLWLNRVIGWICGLLIFLPPNYFRYFHLAHHRHTHDPERDPELQGEAIKSRMDYFKALTGVPVWIFHFTTLFRNAAGRVDYDFLPQSAKARTVFEARLMLAIYAAIFVLAALSGPGAILFLWLFPILLGQPFLRLYLMAEHGRCPHVANMFENTRTTFTNAIVRWLAWNMPFHAEHHAYPAVPFHQLPDFHGFTKEHLQITANGYRRFHDDFYNHLPSRL